MNPLKLSTLIATGALLMFSTGVQAQGDVVEKITVKLVARASVDVDTGSDVISKSKFITQKLTNREILNALGGALGQDFTGASLVLNNSSVEVRQGTNVLADVSAYFTTDESDPVAAETNNSDNGKDNYKGYKTQQIHFDDGAGHSFTFNGLNFTVRTLSPTNAEGDQKFADTQIITGSGSGSWDGNSVIVTGTVTVKGKGTTSGGGGEF